MQSVTRYIVTGILTVIPLWVTVWVVWFVVDLLIQLGRPIVGALSRTLRPTSGGLADLLIADWFQSALAVVITLAVLALLGRAANAVIGRRLLSVVNRIVDAIPLARTVYGATQTLIDALRGDGTPGGQRVVLIEFPTPEMRAVGIVTRIFPATEDREELAAVYVATTPNPTSGFVEIVPTSRLVWLDWTKNDAIAFIVSGGAMAPDNIRLKNTRNSADPFK
ncbi:DUF502 domain-containing protein [Allomesorhizobium alhagi]|uniref:DUF502 domain-containing protein n=1 Tax=Mesorhizobium alhagi CCNWXJ12-2 TaxID=1107882 RepID=H0I119_9HYPH|nr:DUF502 domain-containing protein [Mesorhizobium alhagi]EHK53312.1 hypothetical protein MAXJ12_30782 [Mesorhizobium alhagi CCNWXJ12-2]